MKELKELVSWFKHAVSNKSPEIESLDMMTPLFKMMEKFTGRMKHLERQLYN